MDEGNLGAVRALHLRVANAGEAMSGMPVAEMDDAKVEQLLRVDLMAPLFCAWKFIQAQGRGRIVFAALLDGAHGDA